MKISVDPSTVLGPVKPVNGVGRKKANPVALPR